MSLPLTDQIHYLSMSEFCCTYVLYVALQNLLLSPFPRSFHGFLTDWLPCYAETGEREEGKGWDEEEDDVWRRFSFSFGMA